jgi:lycopene cyclase domain-containing protein
MMTFGQFLLYCMLPPVLLLLWLQRHTLRPSYLLINLGGGVGSIFYTFPWDRWLLAKRVWWFDASRSSGIAYAGFPLEEALFYVLIIALGGLWTHFLYHRLAPEFGPTPRQPVGRWAAGVLALWLADVAVLLGLTRWLPALTFAAQCLLITLPALALLVALCGDFLWHRRRFIAGAVLVPGLYLSLVAGTFTFGTRLWVVDPRLHLGMLFDMIPVEMPFFYLLASALIALPSTVLLAYEPGYFEKTWIGRAGFGRLRAV